MAAKEKEGELTLQDVYGVPHPITASVYHAMLGLGWLAFILSIGCNLIFYAIHPANVDMWGIRDKIPKMPWKKRKDEENTALENEKDDFGPDKVTAAFQFTAEAVDELSMNEGECFTVVEQDLHSNGWTKLRSLKSGSEGYVPTSYLNIK